MTAAVYDALLDARAVPARPRRVVVVGAGGHARVVLDALLADAMSEVIALTDARVELLGTTVFGVPVAGDDGVLPHLRRLGATHAVVGVGSTVDTSVRAALFARLLDLGLEPAVVVHPHATIARGVVIGEGTVVLARAVVNVDARLGRNVIVNSGAIVEHGCVVGDHAHVAPGAQLAAGVRVGEGAHIGLGSSVLEGRTVGASAVVGAGAVVVRDVPPGQVVVGVPARPLAQRGAKGPQRPYGSGRVQGGI